MLVLPVLLVLSALPCTVTRQQPFAQSSQLDIKILLKGHLIGAMPLSAARLHKGKPQIVRFDNPLKQMANAFHYLANPVHKYIIGPRIVLPSVTDLIDEPTTSCASRQHPPKSVKVVPTLARRRSLHELKN